MSDTTNLPRRGFLGGLFGGAAVLAVASPTHPGEDLPAALAAPAPSTLAALDRRLLQLIAERERADTDLEAARDRFEDTCPRRPRALLARSQRDPCAVLAWNESTDMWNRGAQSGDSLVYSLPAMLDEARRISPQSRRGQWLARRIALAETFEAEADAAWYASGYPEAEARANRLNCEIKACAQAIFALPPATSAEIVPHARAIRVLLDSGHDGGWARYAPTDRLVDALLNLSLV